MKSGVWEKLPQEPPEMEGRLIGAAFFAVTNYSALVPRPGAKAKHEIWEEWAKILHKHPPAASPQFAMLTAGSLLREVCELRQETRANWERFWKGDSSMSPEKAIDLIEQLALFYGELEKEHQQHLASLPKINRPFSKKSPQHFFAKMMSDYFEKHYGRPFYEVVTALTEVAFDVSEGLNQESIRALRRAAKAPEKSRRKST
jgi:hypothetical protein